MEPFGAAWQNVQTALLATILANQARDPKKKSDPYTVEDFMMLKDYRKRPDTRSPLEQLRDRLG